MKLEESSSIDFLAKLAIAKADFTIGKMTDGGHNPPPQIDDTQPLIKDATRVANLLLKLLIHQLECAGLRNTLQELEDSLEKNGDKISAEDKKRLEEQGEKLWEGIQRTC